MGLSDSCFGFLATGLVIHPTLFVLQVAYSIPIPYRLVTVFIRFRYLPCKTVLSAPGFTSLLLLITFQILIIVDLSLVLFSSIASSFVFLVPDP